MSDVPSSDRVTSSCISDVKQFIPKLTSKLHKGQCGRIGVVGGSREYTGAPYFAAMAALKSGADLVYVICFHEAAPVIKSYSPELIVYPFLEHPQVVQKISPCLERLHSLVIGPGLGRHPDTFKNVEAIIQYCNEMKAPLPLIIDADGLFLITQKPELVQNYQGPVILTPNVIEYSRLCQKLSINESELRKVATDLNVLLLRKGETDVICNGFQQNTLKLDEDDITISCKVPGSVRRCGGQGDVLSGCTALFVAWFILSKYKTFDKDMKTVFKLGDLSNLTEYDVVKRKMLFMDRYDGFNLACFAACCITRQCSNIAFTKYGRSMTTSDMLSVIHDAFYHCFGE